MEEVPRRPINKETFIDLNLKVSHLISSNGSWNMPRLEDLFPEGDIKRIIDLSIASDVCDSWIWPFTRSGEYTIKSGYTFFKCQQTLSMSSIEEVDKVKQSIWWMHTMPKIKVFFLASIVWCSCCGR